MRTTQRSPTRCLVWRIYLSVTKVCFSANKLNFFSIQKYSNTSFTYVYKNKLYYCTMVYIQLKLNLFKRELLLQIFLNKDRTEDRFNYSKEEYCGKKRTCLELRT